MLSLHSLPPFSAPIHRLTRPQIQSPTNKPNSLTLTHTRTHFLTHPPHRGPTATPFPFLLLLPRAIPSPDPNDNATPSKSTDDPDDCSSSDDNNCSSSNDDKSTDEGDDKSTDEGDDKSTDEGDDKSTDDSDDKQPVHAKNTSSSTLQLAVVFGTWYLHNVIFNIYNKKALNLFPYPWLLASFHLFVASLWMAFLWLARIQPYPKVSRRFFIALSGPALFHTIAHVSASISLSKLAVSFTHVIKASEPVFSVIFSALHGQFHPIHVWLSVMPIVFGCSLAVVTEVPFNAQGLWGALISNAGFVLRNIYSEQSLYSFKHVDGLNLYGWMSIISLLYLFPVAVLVEGEQWVGGFQRAVAMSSSSPWSFYCWVILSGVFYHLYNQSSYQALDKISPVTFSVGNTMKRVVVIVASLLVFRNPIRPLNALGSAIAVFGTFLYSQATMMGKNKKIQKAS